MSAPATLIALFSAFIIYARLAYAVEGSTSLFATNRTVVNVRIEGSEATIFQGAVLANTHVVTTPSGGTHKCDGTNYNAFRLPLLTATAALDDASKKASFTWDAAWYASFDDFFVTKIGPDNKTSNWAFYVNYKLAQQGGCQTPVDLDDTILWAYNGFSATAILRISGPQSVTVSSRATYKVVNGLNNAPIANATIFPVGLKTDKNGEVTFTWLSISKGVQPVQASLPGAIRSNILDVFVVSGPSKPLVDQD